MRIKRMLALIICLAIVVSFIPVTVTADIPIEHQFIYGTQIVSPTVNFYANPVGVDRDAVRFGWQMQSTEIGQYQKDYQIIVKNPADATVWDSGVVASGLATGIAYGGPQLALETKYTWTVTVTDKFDQKLTSTPATFLTGADWTGTSWIYPQKGTATLAGDYTTASVALSGNTWDVASGANWQTAMNAWFGYIPNNPTWEGSNSQGNYVRMGGNPLLRTEATLTGASADVVSATLYMTALGNYEPYINGEKVLMADPQGNLVEPMFAPGGLDYTYNVHYQTYDVTDLVQSSGDTVVVGADMSKGYYAGRVASSAFNTMTGVPNHTAASRTLALRGKLIITYADGSQQVVGTDAANWRSMAGPVIFNDYYNGEIKDGIRAAQLEGWSEPGFDVSNWLATSSEGWTYDRPLLPDNRAVARWADEMTLYPVNGHFFTTPTTRGGADAVPNRVDLTGEDFEVPITMAHNATLAQNRILSINFGQNTSGTVELQMVGDAGTIVRIRHGEVLNAAISGTGNGGRDAQIGSLYYGAMRGSDGQVSYYKLNGDPNGEVWRPHKNYNGFQHVEISIVAGGSVTFNEITSRTITSAHNRTVEFETNDWAINRMVENGYWGTVSNWITIPTDCNQRSERVAWTGDAQVIAPAAAYMFDAIPFLDTYNNIMDQHFRRTGTYSMVMPVGNYNTGGPGNTSVGWSDAGIIIPWKMYQQSGDLHFVRHAYDSMNRYMDRIWGNGPQNNGTVTISDLPVVRYDTFHTSSYGDWLAFRGAHLFFLNMIFNIYNHQLMIEIAEALDDTEAVAKYTARHDELKEIFLSPPVVAVGGGNRQGYMRTGGGFVYDQAAADFVNAIPTAVTNDAPRQPGDLLSFGSNQGSITAFMDNAQTALSWALKLGLYHDEAHKQHLINQLVAVSRNENRSYRPENPEYSIGVGFLGVNVLMPVKSDMGLVESAYRTIFQDQFPGWMAPVRMGATTWWERWDSWDSVIGFGAAGMNSFNHFAYGCINEWFFEYVSGFQPVISNPGFKEFTLQPTVDPTGRLTDVLGQFDSLYGRIESTWEADDGAMIAYKAVVPANTSATLYLPITYATEAAYIEANDGAIEGATYVGPTVHNGEFVTEFKLVSGTFNFTAAPSYRISLTNTNPEMAALISINGVDPFAVPSRVRVAVGEEVTLRIIPADVEEYAFAAWGGDISSTNSEITFTPEGDMELTYTLVALWEYAIVSLDLQAGSRARNTDFLLSINGTEPQVLPGSLRLRVGQSYTLAVSALYPDEYEFLGWSGDIVATTGTIGFTTKGNMNLVINFRQEIEYYDVVFNTTGIPRNSFAAAPDVTISVSSVKDGAVAKLATAGVTHEFVEGREYTVEIKAANDVDFVFANWSNADGTVSSDNPLTFAPSSNMTLTANFVSTGLQEANLALTSKGASALFSSNAANTTTWKHANLLDGNIVPNNPTTNSLGWSSNSLGSATPATRPWIAINLGAVKTVDTLLIYPRMDVFTSANGTCYFPTEFTLEYTTGNLANFPAINTGATQYTAGGTNMPTVAEVNALNWQPIPGGNNGVFTVAASDIPYLKPLVLELPEGINARYVRITVHRVNAMAADTTTNWYCQAVAIGAFNSADVVAPVFKEALIMALENAPAAQGSYTDESWQALLPVVAAGWAVVDDATATQADVDDALAALLAALDGLELTDAITSIRIKADAVQVVVRKMRFNFGVEVNDGATASGITWTVSNPLFASVDDDGTVTIFNRTGIVILTATAPDGGPSHSITLRIL